MFHFQSDADIISLLSTPSRCCTLPTTDGDTQIQSVEGVYLRLESNDRLIHRSKVVREDFIQTIHDGHHWSHRLIEKNRLATGAHGVIV